MKKFVGVFVAVIVFCSACGVKPYYETKEGKRKQRFYNDIQYGHDKHPKKTF